MEIFLNNHLKGILELVLTLVVVYVIFKGIDKFDDEVKEKIKVSSTNNPILGFIPLFVKIIKLLIVLIVVASILEHHGYSMTSLVAGFGITGLAVGFAAKETIANFFGSFAILTDKVFNIGDYVIIGEHEGYVEEITLRSTKIRTLDNTLVIIPNNLTANEVVTNVSSSHKRRIDEKFGITYNMDDVKIQRALDIIKQVISDNSNIFDNSTVVLSTLAESSIELRAVAYTKTADWSEFINTKSDFIKEVVKRFRAEGIEFAFPTSTVYLKNEN